MAVSLSGFPAHDGDPTVSGEPAVRFRGLAATSDFLFHEYL